MIKWEKEKKRKTLISKGVYGNMYVCFFSKWCSRPELNRHGPVKEPQDFKICHFKS